MTRSASLLARVDGLLEHAERLARSGIVAAEFHQQVLGELTEILQADGIALWTIREDNATLIYDTRTERAADGVNSAAELVSRIEADRTVIVPPNAGGRLPNHTEFARCAACLTVAPSLRLVLDVRLPALVQRGENIGEIVSVLGASVVEFHRGQFLSRLLSLTTARDRLAVVCQSLHAALDRQQIALELANDGATALKLDRVSVLLAHTPGSDFRLAAATAVGELNRRANASRAMEQLVAELREQGHHLPWTTNSVQPGSHADHSIEAIVSRYLSESGARYVRVEPLGLREGLWDSARAAVIWESFADEPPSGEFDAIPELCRHAAVALNNASRFESQGWLGRLRQWQRLASSRSFVTASGTILAVLVLLLLIPADFELEARGQVQPARRRHVFAPSDGIITQVAVQHGQPVRANGVLLSMRNPEWDLDEQRIRGEISTANARLSSVRAARGDLDRRGSSSTTAAQLTAEEQELKQQIDSLERQLRIVNQQIAELTVRAPMDGQVVRWDLIHVLESRPVRQGQLLMQVIDAQGPWQLELRVPDRAVRHVLAAQSQSNERLPVRFLFRMAPRQTFASTLESLNLATDLDADGELSTLATVPVNPGEVPDLRPGSSVVAKIHCGRRSLGYVWLREAWEFVQTKVFF